MDVIRYLKNDHKETLNYFAKLYYDLTRNLDPIELEALNWIRKGLKADDYVEKYSCYDKVRQILGGFLLR